MFKSLFRGNKPVAVKEATIVSTDGRVHGLTLAQARARLADLHRQANAAGWSKHDITLERSLMWAVEPENAQF